MTRIIAGLSDIRPSARGTNPAAQFGSCPDPAASASRCAGSASAPEPTRRSLISGGRYPRSTSDIGDILSLESVERRTVAGRDAERLAALWTPLQLHAGQQPRHAERALATADRNANTADHFVRYVPLNRRDAVQRVPARSDKPSGPPVLCLDRERR